MKILTIGTTVLALLSLLMLAFLNLFMVQGVFLMINDGSALRSFPTILPIILIGIIGIAATLFAIAAAFLQLRRARPKLTRAAALSAATFYCALFSFFWVGFIIIERKEILSADYLADSKVDASHVLLISLLWVGAMMIFPVMRNWLGAKYVRSQSAA